MPQVQPCGHQDLGLGWLLPVGSALLAVGGAAWLAAAEAGVGAEEPPLRAVDPPCGLLAAALATGTAGRPPGE